MQQAERTAVGIGLAATTPLDAILATAGATADGGFGSFWVNNPPGHNGLEILGRVAAQSPTLQLGIGVIPLSHMPPEAIAAGVRAHHVPTERLYLGVGSGGAKRALTLVADGLHALHRDLEGRVVVAALGPRMCRLAGAEADGVLFNWLTPTFAQRSVEWVREGAQQAGRPIPRLMAYVRVALGEGAQARLRGEADNYQAIPNYASHFERMGVSALDTAISAANAADVQAGVAAWEGVVDEVVLRVVTANDTVQEYLQLVAAAQE